MKPLPAGNPDTTPAGGKPALQLPTAFPAPRSAPAAATSSWRKRLSGRSAPLPVYPVLLTASTLLASLFCYLYLTKPVIVSAAPAIAPPATEAAAASPPAVSQPATTPAALLPGDDHLPGDSRSASTAPDLPGIRPDKPLPGARSIPAFEETNLRIQHILTAESPAGDLSRIVLDVPVLYQTGNLAWTDVQVAESRVLLEDLTNFQEQARELRDEGARLLVAWNRLLAQSIPAPILRADSPALPANQNPEYQPGSPPGIDTTRSIQLQTAGK